MTGRERCRMHGGAAGSGSEPIHGLYTREAKAIRSGRIRSLQGAAAQRLEELLESQDLADTRLPVALSRLTLDQIEVIPSPEMITELAARSFGCDPSLVTDAQRAEVVLQWMERVNEVVRRLEQATATHRRAEAKRDIIVDTATPFLIEVARMIAGVAVRYVEKDKHDRLRAEMQLVITSQLERLEGLL